MSTAESSSPFFGDKKYQQRARAAMPILVRQAWAGSVITYADIAAELGMSNPRNMNYVLGCIGQTLLELSKNRRHLIPPIQCVVINKNTGLPGEGVGWFLGATKDEFESLAPDEQRAVLARELQRVYTFRQWREVLKELGLEQPKPAARSAQLVKSATAFGGGGESEGHRLLKELIAANPSFLHSPDDIDAHTEYALPSGDSVDVMFHHGGAWVAVEVKSMISGEPDLLRGLFQCVKYNAVMRAQLVVNGREPHVRAILALEGRLPSSLLTIKNTLGIEVVENVRSSDA
jgi:hypothetical protein